MADPALSPASRGSTRGGGSPADAPPILDAQPEARLRLDADGRVAEIDERAQWILGRPASQVSGTLLTELVSERDRIALGALLTGLAADGSAQRAEAELIAADGRERLAELIFIRHPGDTITVYLHDISARRLAEQVAAATQAASSAMARAASPERAIETLLDSLGGSMGWAAGTYWTADHGGTLERIAAWRDPGGPVSEADLAGELRLAREGTVAGRALDVGETQWVADLQAAAEPFVVGLSGMRSAVAVPLASGGRTAGVIEFVSAAVRAPDEGVRRALTAAAGQAAELLGIIEERHHLVASLARLALTDELTGLPNRRAWEEALHRELARAARGGHPVCVAVLDLDDFKSFNDEHGHQAGDRLLAEAARAWHHQLRASDLLARYGGEEFAALIPAWPLATAVEVVERLRRATPGGLTASAGVASWDRVESGVELFGRADAALYEAKQAGRDRTGASAQPGPS